MNKEDHLNESEKGTVIDKDLKLSEYFRAKEFCLLFSVAKEHVLRMISKGFNKPCAEEISKNQDLEIPHWYDEQKYKR